MEETVVCQWCGQVIPKSEASHETQLGYLCDQCIKAIESRGEQLEFDEEDK